MQEIDAKIIKKRIISSDIFVSESLAKTFELSMNCRAQMKTPKDENDRSVLLNIELSIDAKGEELKIKLVSDFIFECSQVPDDYNELAEQNLTPMAMEALLNDLDEMLVVMGYKKMELAKKI